MSYIGLHRVEIKYMYWITPPARLCSVMLFCLQSSCFILVPASLSLSETSLWYISAVYDHIINGDKATLISPCSPCPWLEAAEALVSSYGIRLNSNRPLWQVKVVLYRYGKLSWSSLVNIYMCTKVFKCPIHSLMIYYYQQISEVLFN